MRKFTSVLVTLLLPVLMASGCAATWWQDFKSDPSTQVQMVLANTEIVKGVATATFETIKMQLPADKQVLAEAEFQKAILAVGVAENAILAAVSVASDTQQSKPDFLKVFADLSVAIVDVQQIINLYKGQSISFTASKTPSGLTSASYELDKEVSELKTRLARK